MKMWACAAAVSVLAIAALAACGDDSSGGTSRSEAVDKVIDQAKDDGVELEKDCVSDAVNDLSDDDFDKIDESGDGELDLESLSDEGQEIVVRILDCQETSESGLTGTQQMIFDQLKTSLAEMGTVDEDCLLEVVKTVDASLLASQDADAITELGTQAQECVS